jgi:hypothetical protein
VAAPSTAYAATLNITVKTSKPSYQVGEYITIQGSLTYNGLPVQSNTVGLQVLDPDNNIVVSRTLQTNATGGYSLTFSLPADAIRGTYTVQVSSTYNGVTATNSTSFTYTTASSSVGGIELPIDKFALLTPYIGLTSAILAAAIATTVYVKRVKRREKKQ